MEEEARKLPVSADDLNLVESAHPDKVACPSCGNHTWFTVQGPGEKLPVLPQGNLEGGLLVANGHPLVTLACMQCGYIKSHIKQLFDEYVQHLREMSEQEEAPHERD